MLDEELAGDGVTDDAMHLAEADAVYGVVDGGDGFGLAVDGAVGGSHDGGGEAGVEFHQVDDVGQGRGRIGDKRLQACVDAGRGGDVEGGLADFVRDGRNGRRSGHEVMDTSPRDRWTLGMHGLFFAAEEKEKIAADEREQDQPPEIAQFARGEFDEGEHAREEHAQHDDE